MRNITLGLLLLSTVLFTSAQTSVVCTDITANISRGAESKNVLALQNFLVAKGYLKATPNGYFGPATFTAAKVYQASIGLPNTGAVLSMTRAAIKKESCTSSLSQTPTSPTQSGTATTTIKATSIPLQVTYFPRPSITSIDKGTLFAGATATWNAIIIGTSFNTSSNIVYFRNLGTGRKYTIGSFQALDGKTITLPQTLTTDMYSCGGTCKETLPIGNYEVTVAHEGGEGEGAYLTIKGFSISSVSGSLNGALKQNATSTRIGTISFSPTVPVYVTDISVTVSNDGLGAGTVVSGLSLKDEMTGQSITSYGSSVIVNENESKIIGIYGNINTQSSGTLIGSVKVTINDFIGQKAVSFTSPTFLTSVSGF